MRQKVQKLSSKSSILLLRLLCWLLFKQQPMVLTPRWFSHHIKVESVIWRSIHYWFTY